MFVKQFRTGGDRNLGYLVADEETRAAVIIDPSYSPERIVRFAQDEQYDIRYVFSTHDHHDHTNGNRTVEQLTGRRALLFGGQDPETGLVVEDGARLPLGSLEITVLHTPGHTPGSLCFKTEGYLISGDTLFPGGPGKTGTPADFAQVVKSITEKIFTLDDDTPVYPGHGESTIIKKAKEEYKIFSSRPHDPNLCGDVLWLTS